MTKRYIKAILIGSAIGIFALASEAARQYDRCLLPTPFDLQLYIPIWDDAQTKELAKLRPDLQIKAVFLRFCLLFMAYGYYFLLVPIGFSFMMVKLGEVRDEYSLAVSFRRAIKSAGLVLLFLLTVMTIPVVFSRDTLMEGVGEVVLNIWELFKTSIFFGVAEIIFLIAFGWHLFCADYLKRSAAKSQSHSES